VNNTNTARFHTVKALGNFFKTDTFSDVALSKLLEQNSFADNDRRFAAALFYGVIERKITLDYIIGLYAKKAVDPEIRNILRAGLYQILFMDSVPDRAAVDESVKLCEAFGKTSAKGFVNAILRQFLRDDKIYKLPDENLSALSVLYSINKDIVKSFADDYGYERAIEILEGFIQSDCTYIRLNTVRFDEDDLIKALQNITATDIPGCFITDGNIINTTAFRDGMFHVQDYSCAAACELLDIKGSEDILDLCSAPGGKSFTLAQKTSGTVCACDISAKRLKLVEDGKNRLGLVNIKTLLQDGRVFNETLPTFSRILCDVPCSGLGVIRKKPEIKYKNTADFGRLSDIQYDILETAIRYLSPGGKLVYSTCTLRRDENERVVERFLEAHPDYTANMNTIFPGKSDGFFTAVIKKA
jgi:16S rRNA (cytosine967-C5)-methyltransferase